MPHEIYKKMGYALNSKNRVFVPIEVQRALRVSPGDELDFELLPEGKAHIIAIKKSNSELESQQMSSDNSKR
jgi:bifunctional DNA-binding transcriptional regulator/antitoxin component of YhaV-PrlF toxin-antitoxin module